PGGLGAGAATGAVEAARTGAAVAVAALRLLAEGVFAGSAVWYIIPWRGLILPPPGGVPYLATISGCAMIADFPRSSVVIVVGTLSSSTQTYSGSLATSPYRGFLMSSQRGSADLMTTEGSPVSWTPRIFLTMLQPETATTGSNSQ